MAPTGSRRSCVVCGKFPKDKKSKPLVSQDDFWKQHAEDIRTGSQVPLKEFLKYFGISLDSVAVFAKARDVDQVLNELIICNDCSDWVMYGAFLKEKFLWVEQVLRNKIRNAFIAGRLQYRTKSSVDHIAAVVEQIRQCLMPCCVVVDKDGISDELNRGTEPTTNLTCAKSPPAKRPRTRGLKEEVFVLENAELNTRIVTADEPSTSNDNGGGDNGADDNLMDYDDPFYGNDNDDELDGLEPSENESEAEAVAVINTNMEKAGLNHQPIKKIPGPKSKTGNKVKPKPCHTGGTKPGLSRCTFVISKECPICKKDVPHYIRHMAMHHRVKPHRYLLNNFWCKRCKNAYQPPDLDTPTGQYLPQHHDAFLNFIQTHSHCRVPNLEPHHCRFCEYVSSNKRRAASNCIQHESTFHPDMFGADYPLTRKDTEARRAVKRANNMRQRAKVLEVHCPTKKLSLRYGLFQPIRKTCPICVTIEEDYQEHMTEHNVNTHPIFLDFFCCMRCKLAYQPPDQDAPTGKYLPKDHEFFLKFIEKHKSCSYTESWPPHACRYCEKVEACSEKAAFDCIDHEILTHPEEAGEYPNLIRRDALHESTYAPFKNNPGNCTVCNVKVTAYGLHMMSEHNVLPHWIYSNYFICRHCKLPFEPPNRETPIGKYQRQDRGSFLRFISAHSNCVKRSGRASQECRFCKEPFDVDPQLDPFYLITHQIKQHWELIGEDPNRPLPKAALCNKLHKLPFATGGAVGTSPQSPLVVLNEFKNEICNDDENTMEDPLMMDDFMANTNSDTDNATQNDDQNTTESADAVVSPETIRCQKETPQTESLGLELDTSGVRRSTRSRKPIVAAVDSGCSSTSASEAEGEDIDDEDRYEDQDVVEIGSSTCEESEECWEREEDVDSSASKKPKKRIKIRKKKLKKLTWHPQKPSKLSDDDDHEEPDDCSEKVSCVVCDTQRSRPKLPNHYKVNHNLVMKPDEGYFGCRGCKHAFISPNENIPTGKFIPEDIEYLKEFIKDHDSCRNLSAEKHAWKQSDSIQLHFCRYCFTKFQGSDSMTDCIQHETRNHQNGIVGTDSTLDVPSVFLFYCVYCKFKTDALADIYIHMRSHKKPHRFGCCKCDSQFKDVRELTYHIRLHGTSSEEVFDSCLLCDAYMDSLSLVGHYRQNHGLEMVNYKYFGCWHCEEAFLPEQLERQSGTVFGDDLEHLANFVVKHESCKLSRQHPAKEQKCRKCPNTFTTMRQLVEHEEIKHLESHFVPDLCCRVCDRTFLSDEGLQKHSGLHLPEEYGFQADVPFLDCPDCYFSCEIFNKCQFDLHISLHNPDKFEKDKRFRKVSQIQFVQRRVARPPSATICHICDKGKTPTTFRNPACHYHRSHNLIQYYNQMYCCGCEEILVNEEGAPRLMDLDNPTDEILQQLRNFAVKHKECPKGPEKPVKCVECPVIKKNVCRYLDHYATHRNSIGRFVLFPQLHCLRCGEAFTSILQLRDHLKGKVQALKCRGCKLQFMTKESYAKHNCSTGTIDPEPESTSDPPPYLTFRTGGLNCLTCITVFDTLTEFNLHFKHCHNDASTEVKFQCSACHEVQEPAAGLGSEDFPRICADHEAKCKARAIKEGSKTCEDFSWPDLTCFLCQETFDSVQRYSSHINEHFGSSADVFCPVCPAVFSETEELRHHVTLHGLTTTRLYQGYFSCRLQGCLWISERPEAESGRLYPQDLSQFQVFAETHAKCTNPRFKAFSCKFCGVKFQASTRLYAHEPQHTKNWQVYCEECGRGLSSELRLKLHMKIHQEKFMFVCNHCPYKGRHRSELKEHMNVHNGVRPCICDKCGKGFTTKKRLREHVQYVHNKPTEKKFPCNSGCDLMFATRREARVHELKAHNRPVETRRRNQFRDFNE